MTTEKLQKILANAGLGSRRQIEQWIEAGRVSIDGQLATLGDRVDAHATIRVDGHVIKRQAQQATRILMYHKPEGEICTRHDPENRPTVFDHLPMLRNQRWIQVGRLDFNTSGLLLFTNDGELANRLMHPKYEIEREYAVRVLGEVTKDMLRVLVEGVQLEDGPAKFTKIREAGGEGANRWYHVTLSEGRNREVRRLWESQNLTVSRLSRIRFGQLTLPRFLKAGRWEEMSAEAVDSFVASLPEATTLAEVQPHQEAGEAAPVRRKPLGVKPATSLDTAQDSMPSTTLSRRKPMNRKSAVYTDKATARPAKSSIGTERSLTAHDPSAGTRDRYHRELAERPRREAVMGDRRRGQGPMDGNVKRPGSYRRPAERADHGNSYPANERYNRDLGERPRYDAVNGERRRGQGPMEGNVKRPGSYRRPAESADQGSRSNASERYNREGAERPRYQAATGDRRRVQSSADGSVKRPSTYRKSAETLGQSNGYNPKSQGSRRGASEADRYGNADRRSEGQRFIDSVNQRSYASTAKPRQDSRYQGQVQRNHANDERRSEGQRFMDAAMKRGHGRTDARYSARPPRSSAAPAGRSPKSGKFRHD